nr:hypothetical protein [Nanoarchaeum sp.]
MADIKQNKYPKIEFKVNNEAEKEVAYFFLKKRYFDSFIRSYPELKKAKDMNEKEGLNFLIKEIDSIYLIKEKELLEKKKEIESNWDKIKDNFFKETEKLFEHKWPSGKYIANISVFSMFRLKPGTKVFSIPSEDYAGNPPSLGHINYTITHEMMHILFEDYYKTHFKGRLELEEYYDFLEIVNCIILNLPQFKAITKWVTYPYPEHKERYEHLKQVYKDCNSMKEFVEKAIEYIKK